MDDVKKAAREWMFSAFAVPDSGLLRNHSNDWVERACIAGFLAGDAHGYARGVAEQRERDARLLEYQADVDEHGQSKPSAILTNQEYARFLRSWATEIRAQSCDASHEEKKP